MAQGLLEDFKITDIKLPVPLPDTITIAGTTLDVRNMDKAAEQVFGNATSTLFDIGIALGIVLGGWMISSWLASATQRAFIRARIEETVAAFLGSTVRYLFFLMCIFAAFNAVGVSLTGAIAVFGAAGLAVAFALRNTLTHLASGVMLIINRPFRVGDFVELDGIMGTVKRITLFNTEVNTLTNHRLFIPNTRIWENVLQNHTYNEVRAIEGRVTFANDDAPDLCKKALQDAFAKEELVLTKPEPYVSTDAFAPEGTVYLYRVYVRTRDYGTVRQQLLDGVWHSARRHKLTLNPAPRVRHVEAAPLPALKAKPATPRTRK